MNPGINAPVWEGNTQPCVEHIFNVNTTLGRLKQEDHHKFEASLGYMGRPFLRGKKNPYISPNLKTSEFSLALHGDQRSYYR